MTGGTQKSFYHNKNRYFVDGFCAEKNKVYEFHGCYWHGHTCNTAHTGPHPSKSKHGKTYEQVLAETNECTRILKEELKLEVEEIWECEWKTQKQTSPVKKFLKDAFPAPPASYFSKDVKAPYTSEHIIDAFEIMVYLGSFSVILVSQKMFQSHLIEKIYTIFSVRRRTWETISQR